MSQRAPYVDLSVMARVEAHRKNIYRPAYYVHKWWARRIGSVFRGIALDLLLPAEADVMTEFYRAHDFSDVVVLDPFMGGGTTIGETLRLGCKVIGCDLNPVAWYLVSQSMRDADVSELKKAFAFVEREVGQGISEMYRATCGECGGEATAQYTSWVKQVPCGACGSPADLNLTQVVMADMATKGAGLVACPGCGHAWWTPSVKEAVDCPECSTSFVPAAKRCKNTHYHCDECGHSDTIVSAVKDLDGPPSHRMRLLTVWCDKCGKTHRKATPEDLARYEAVAENVRRRFDEMHVPRESIPAGYNTDQARRYRYEYWYQMFNPRQLAGLEMLFAAIRRVEDKPARELLTLLASASLEFNSMFCGAKGLGTGAIRHVFAHHAFIPAKEPLEANLWGVHRSSGGFSTLFKERLLRAREWANAPIERQFTGDKAVKVPIQGERLAARPAETWDAVARGEADMLILNQSSELLHQIPDGSVDFVITDPPYADSVMYSELSDYFYVWLRQALKDDYPNFEPPSVDDEREAVLNPTRGRDGNFYTDTLTAVFAEANRKLKSGGRFAFTFHHSGEDAWRYIEDAIAGAGLVVERWWPVFAEMESGVPLQGKENNGHLDIVFVCAKAGEVSEPVQQDSVETMGTRLSERVRLVAADHRALLQATAVQAGTFRRANESSARAA